LTGHTHANRAVMSVDHRWRPTNPGPGVARPLTECQYTTAGPIGAQVKELPDLSLHRLLHWSLPTNTYIIHLLSRFISVLVSFSPLPSDWSFAPPHMPTYHCTDYKDDLQFYVQQHFGSYDTEYSYGLLAPRVLVHHVDEGSLLTCYVFNRNARGIGEISSSRCEAYLLNRPSEHLQKSPLAPRIE